MSKVITLTRNFMKGHPRAGESTHFVEKLIVSIGINNVPNIFDMNPWLRDDATPLPYSPVLVDRSAPLDKKVQYLNSFDPKNHTIRMGRRWLPEETASVRVWSGRPYDSKQIIIWEGPIRAVDLEIHVNPPSPMPKVIPSRDRLALLIPESDTRDAKILDIDQVAANDGLSTEDFRAWFNLPVGIHEAQILIWNPNIHY